MSSLKYNVSPSTTMKISTQSVPGFTSTPFTRLALGVGFGAIAIAITSVLLPQPASAQSAGSVKPLQDLTTQQNEQDSFSGGFGNGSFSVFNLIHQAQLGTPMDMDEFSSQQNQNLTDAAAKFRLEQQRLLGNPQPLGSEQQALPGTQVQTPQAGQ
jgi:hypothetical protein